MSSSFGENIRVSIFGQSHSGAIGVTVDGLPAGEKIDLAQLQRFLDRRAPGRNDYSTTRREAAEERAGDAVRVSHRFCHVRFRCYELEETQP
jgi:chorismate synthase